MVYFRGNMIILLIVITVIIMINLNSILGIMHVKRYKKFKQEEQKIAAKYGGTGYPALHISTHEHGKEAYEKYTKECDQLQSKFRVGKYDN